MIYLIKSSAYKNKECTEYEDILKIGYTGDNDVVSKKRFIQYYMSNPTCKILYTISGGTLEDEAKLHYKFRHLRKYRNEWYRCSNEILEYFKTHTTKDSLSDLPDLYEKIPKPSVIKRSLWPIVVSLKKVIGFLDTRMYKFNIASEEFGLQWVCENYPDVASMVIQEYENLKDIIEREDVKKVVRKLGITKVLITERLKYLCETKDIDETEKKSVASWVSEKFDRYYNFLGPSRCKALNYNPTYLNQEIYNIMVPKCNIKEKFLELFKVGERYTNKDIKITIGNIYTEFGMTKKPKGTDINEYFNVKPVSIITEDKRKINGQEILSIK